MRRSFYSTWVLFLLVFVFLSCKKNTSVDLNPNISSSKDVVLAGTLFQNIVVTLVKARSDSNVMQGTPVMIDSARVTWNLVEKKFLFQYGYLLCPDSVVRIGTIEINTNGDILQQGTRSNVIFSYYEEDGNAVNAVDSLITIGPDNTGAIQFRMRIGNGAILRSNGGTTISFQAEYMVTVEQDANLPGGKIIKFTGNLSGISSHGDNFSSSIVAPVEFRFSCPWPVAGVIIVTIPGADITSGEIRFSTGEGCNNQLKYIIGDNIIPGRKINAWLR